MPLLPSRTSSSLDFTPYILEDSILCESLTLSSLSSSTSSTPPIPAGCMVPLSTIVGHHDGPLMSRPASKATLTTPTPPRLRTMLREKLLVETWLTGVDSSGAGHTPWGDLDTSDATPWKSEGSLHAPDAFKTTLAFARRNRKKDPTPAISVADTSQRTSHRNALVFEREIILDSGGKSSRLSLQASVKMMDPGVAEMISELQDLNSFFKDEGTIVSSPAAPQPPALIVSNSHFSLPVSFESCGNPTPSAPLALAARRGKKMLPPLSFPQASDKDTYPSIPTAFLGSPSTYSPKFEFASQPSRRSMDLQQMVSSLRSQCAPIEPVEEDEWAFADGLLDSYNSRQFEAEFVKKPLLPDMINYAEESLSPKNVESLNPSPPPSTPLPPCPESKPERAVRSILKSSKSVRFASLPDERPTSVASPPRLAPRRSLGSLSPPSKRSPPARPRSYTVRPTTPTPLAPFRPPGPNPSPSPVRIAGQRRATTTAATTSGSPRKAPVGGRHSLGRVFSGKENKDDGPRTPTRWTMNENALRRASISGPAPQKSRMPVPLRNILTRFK